jgi:hypothetical protein
VTTDSSPSDSGNAKRRWTFFRAGGFDQVRLATGADLMALDQLDQKLWVALSCPVKGIEFDAKTLEIMDTDGDGRIRVPEIIAATQWAGSLLKNPDDLTRGASALPLAAINDKSPEGKQLLDSAKHILKNLGRGDAAEITLDDVAAMAGSMAQTKFNGDGIITVEAADDAAVSRTIQEIIDCRGPDTDRSGKPGISQEKADGFFADLQAYSDWLDGAETEAAAILPLGEATADAAAAYLAVRDKVNDYFTRCRLAAFDPRALGALNRQESEYIPIAEKTLSASLEEMSGFPVAQIGARKALPLKEGLNPAWMAAMAAFGARVVRPLLGDREEMVEEEWARISAAFAPYLDWLSGKAGAAVEKLGVGRVREILKSDARGVIAALIAQDQALAPEFNNIDAVDKLVRCHRYLFTLLNNFVSFGDFYTRRSKAVFQVGTLYLDGRSFDLCVRVGDMVKHAALATLSRIYLVYCDCTRRGGTETMSIVAAVTGGDSDFLMVGRNGVFYDRQGADWDATIVRLVEHPISIRQAFWSPYKRIAKMIGNQITKMAAARDKAATDKAATGVAGAGQKLDAGKAPAPAAFDVGKFAGIFAAIGLAVGAIGTALAAVFTGILKLAWWQIPILLAGLVLIISGPSMILAWLKLRQRNLAPILDANGWAVNARVRINVAFGASLTKVAALPEGAVRKLEDPFADKKSPWPGVLLLIAALIVVLYLLNRQGLLGQWLSAIFG